jgi:hypothetical protein
MNPRKHRIKPGLGVPSKPHMFKLETLKLGSTFPTRYPCHFWATRCCVSLLTGTIYGSTLSIPEHFLQIPLEGAMTINAGARLIAELVSLS